MISRGLRPVLLGALLAFAASAWAASPRPNIVLVSIDTLRADRLPFYGHPVDLAPFLNSLAAGGIVFEDAIVPLPNTTPSHGSLLTSLAPPQHGSLSLTTPLARNVDTLAGAFSRLGYATGGFVAVSHVGRAFNFDRGFEAFTQPTELVRPGAAVNADAIAWVDRERRETKPRPLFLFVHYFDMHAPYGWWKDPESAKDDMDSLPAEERIRRYDESIRHVDDLVRRLHAALVERGVLEDALFCVTSDHGEQIAEHGIAAGHADIYRETVRVPLVVSGKGIPAVRIAHPVSSMDIGVSLLKWAGGSFATPVAGRNVLPKSAGALDRVMYKLTRGGGEEERDLLVTGNPPFTRSIALVEGKYWLIRNLDFVYRTVRAGSVPAGPVHGFKALPVAEKRQEDGARYTIPDTAFAPFVVTVDFHPAASCPVDIAVSIPPGLTYFTVSRQSTPVRFQFGASRLDLVSVKTKPAVCGGTVAYRLDRPGSEPRMPDATESVSTLYGLLLAERKSREGDEFYDASADPGMTTNLIASEAAQPVRRRMERSLRELYEKTFGRGTGDDTRRVSLEELAKLRSLGYLF
jgi:arylsulfatase A-like enzyme